jgi:pectate lyase
VEATNAAFGGDPCSFTVKHLDLQATCTDSGAAGTGGTASGGTGSGGAGTGGTDSTGISGDSVALSAALRYQLVRLHVVGTSDCVSETGSATALAACGGENQEFRVQVLSSDYLSIVANGSGKCVNVSGGALGLADCTNAPEQQFSYSGAASAGYKLTSFSGKQPVTNALALGSAAATFEVVVTGEADPVAVVVDERAIGWSTIGADIIVPDNAAPNGDEKTRTVTGTTGGGSWEAAAAKNFSNVYWFKPADFTGSNRAASLKAVSTALSGTDARIVLFEAGNYDFSLASPKSVTSCQGKCGNGQSYTEVDGFCNTSSTGYTPNGYKDATASIDLGSNKTIIGLGSGAVFSHLMMRVVRNGNLIFRNLAYTKLPGDVRAWDDALLFYPGDHVWLDHLSFSGFGRGSVVLSGTRVTAGNTSGDFYTYRDSGWMTFSWLSIESAEPWRCSGTEDSPYPFFTTNDPALTFDHVHFKHGGGRNPAIDGEGAHFINTAWEAVKDGLDGRGNAKLRVEGCYFDGKLPIRMDDPKPPTVYAPWDASTLSDKRAQVIFSSSAWSSIQSDWGKRGLNMATLNTNSVPTVPYPYGLDADPTKVLATVTAGAGVGKGGFPACSVNAANKADYGCQ